MLRARLPLFTLLLAVLSVSMAYGVTLPTLPFLLERIIGRDPAAIARHTGLLTAAYTAATLLFSPLWGAYSDKGHRRMFIVLGLIGSTIGLLVLDQISSLKGLYAARIFSGIASSSVLPISLALLADTTTTEQRPRWLGIAASATTLGFMLGPLVGGALSAMVINPPIHMRVMGGVMLDSPFTMTALVNMVAAGIILLGAPKIAPIFIASRLKAGALPFVDQRKIFGALLLTCLGVYAIVTMEVGLSIHGKQAFGLTPIGITRFLTICSVIMIACQLFVLPRLNAVLTLPQLALGAATTLAIAIVPMPFLDTTTAINIFVGFAAAGIGILIPSLAGLLAHITENRRGNLLGLQVAAADLGQTLSASAAGILYAVDPSIPFLLAAGLLATALVVYRKF